MLMLRKKHLEVLKSTKSSSSKTGHFAQVLVDREKCHQVYALPNLRAETLSPLWKLEQDYLKVVIINFRVSLSWLLCLRRFYNTPMFSALLTGYYQVRKPSKTNSKNVI